MNAAEAAVAHDHNMATPGQFRQYVDYDFTARLEDELDAVSRGEEDWIPLLERFWGPFTQAIHDAGSVERPGGDRVLGSDPATGKPVLVRLGKFGPIAQIGSPDDEDKPRFASLQAGQSIYTITLEQALKLFTLPRVLGQLDGKDLVVAVGRFGPFVKRGDTYASLDKTDDPYEIDFERGAALLRAREELLANRLIRQFEGSPIQVLNGKYGAYITDGEKNGKIPKDRDPKSLSLEECQAILAAAPPRPQRGRFGRKVAAKKAATEGATAPKKAAAKKATKKATKKVAKKAAGKVAKKATRKVAKKTTGGTAKAAKKATKSTSGSDAAAVRPATRA